MAPDRRAERRRALLDALAREGFDGVIVSHGPNVRYLTGFTGSAGVALVLPSETIVITDFRYRVQAEAEASDAARVETVATDVWERVWELVREYPQVERLGFEAHATTVEAARRFADRAAGRPVVEPAGELVEALRVRKAPEEIEAVRAAAVLGHEALEATLAVVRPGMSELAVAAHLECELRRRGGEWHPFATIVASGPRSALPHAGAGARAVEKGEWLLLDFGARVDGYCADITRTVIVGGAPDERQRAVYALVEEAQQAARQNLRAGLTGREADALARGLIDARGFGDAFGHSLGHGLGLEVHEAPRLSRHNTQPLPCDAVVTVEPGVYLEGWGGVRLEDDVWLTDTGAELLTDGHTELRVVG